MRNPFRREPNPVQVRVVDLDNPTPDFLAHWDQHTATIRNAADRLVEIVGLIGGATGKLDNPQTTIRVRAMMTETHDVHTLAALLAEFAIRAATAKAER